MAIALPDLLGNIGASRGLQIPSRRRLSPYWQPRHVRGFLSLFCIGGYRTRRQVRRWSVGHDVPSCVDTPVVSAAATLPRRRDVICAAHYDCLLAVARHRVRGQRDHRDLPRVIVRAIRCDDALRGCHTCALCVGIRTALSCVPAEWLYVRRRPPLSARAIQIRMQAPMKPAIR